VELRFQIPIFSGIPHSLSCILNSKVQDSGIHKQNFLDYRIPQAKISQILDCHILGKIGDRPKFMSCVVVSLCIKYYTCNIIGDELLLNFGAKFQC